MIATPWRGGDVRLFVYMSFDPYQSCDVFFMQCNLDDESASLSYFIDPLTNLVNLDRTHSHTHTHTQTHTHTHTHKSRHTDTHAGTHIQFTALITFLHTYMQFQGRVCYSHYLCCALTQFQGRAYLSPPFLT